MTEAGGPAATETADDPAKPEGGRLIAVLGEMLELGDDSVEAHREIGRYAAEVGVDLVIGVGGDMVKQLVLYAGAAGVREVALVADTKTAADLLEKILLPGDKVLVKASRSRMLWQVAQRLTGQPVTGF
ncbi:UDP-N-acetylmuramoylalanyl-D-glutamate--2,6-diaminopimelate ligase [Streptomyces sp. ET3-23]|uniref:glutamate ligase domain-containing protein n=1 Tax=Streptomyces sp. ET3-23 TaxID=2885643 RepID=UPI001D12B6CA|nr:cyanophycin synthetase [Streptomyces sp. ET3-23]MCC2278851.1 UDP-N-acetylmuramoylalanyl-D-glutamate--2,6-diaminopimelate ligase [Streptomyces sp. ET3-23]